MGEEHDPEQVSELKTMRIMDYLSDDRFERAGLKPKFTKRVVLAACKKYGRDTARGVERTNNAPMCLNVIDDLLRLGSTRLLRLGGVGVAHVSALRTLFQMDGFRGF